MDTGDLVPMSAINAWGVGKCVHKYLSETGEEPILESQDFEEIIAPYFKNGKNNYYLNLTEHWTILSAILRWKKQPGHSLRFLTSRPGGVCQKSEVRYQTEAWLASRGLNDVELCWASGYPDGKGGYIRDYCEDKEVDPDARHIVIEDNPEEAESVLKHMPDAVVLAPRRHWNTGPGAWSNEAARKVALKVWNNSLIYQQLLEPEDILWP